jgi:CheY-like chemotaxis protein
MRLRRSARYPDLDYDLESSSAVHQGPPGADSELSPRPDASPAPRVLESPWEPRVLVVDDDEISRLAAEQLLQSLGLKVDVVSGGEEAIRTSAGWPYVAILMDCGMPEVDGYLAARTIRARERRTAHTPVIAMTSRMSSISIASGLDGHFAKPLELDVLRADLTRLGLLARGGVRPGEQPAMLGTDTPLLEPEILEELAHGNPIGASVMVGQFIERSTRRLPELWRAANHGDLGTLDELAHGLEVSATAVGATRVAEVSGRLGHAAARSATTLAAGIEPSLRQALWDTATAIADYADAAPAGEASAVAVAVAPAPEPEPETAVDEVEPGGPIRVAIADDDPLALLAIGAMIEHRDGMKLVGTATGVEEIVELAALQRPHVVVLDWMMPGGGGPEAARRILYQSPDTQVIALTSSNAPEARKEMMSAGASRVLTKGHSADELDNSIRQILET